MAYNRNTKRKHNYRKYDNRKDRNNKEKRVNVKSSRPSNVTVYPKNNEDPMRTIKRFLKKCKNEKIVEKFREKAYFVKPSEKKRKERMRIKRLIQRSNNANNEQD